MDSSIPFFVYGTLLPSQPNDYYWGRSIVRTADAVYSNGRLVDLHDFPMLLEDEPTTAVVRGVLIYIAAEDYEQVTMLVDRLEDYDPENRNSLYQRVLREVTTTEGERITAWLYVGNQEIGKRYTTIEGGDWIAHLATKGSDGMTRWWRDKGEALLFGRGLD